VVFALAAGVAAQNKTCEATENPTCKGITDQKSCWYGGCQTCHDETSYDCDACCSGCTRTAKGAIHYCDKAATPVVKKYSRGFVRQPRSENFVLPVATITDEMRQSAPAKLDWSQQGATSPVKDQGGCGSCWAFSATEGIESGLYMATKKMTQLSTQEIVACDKDEPDGGGCGGGDLPTAFAWVMKAGGMDTSSDYPDTSSSSGRTGTCKWSGKKVAQVTNWTYAIKPCALDEHAKGGQCKNQDEDGLKAALATFGPLSVCVNAGSWDFYSGGVLSAKCSGAWSKLDHCVQLVGYDTTASKPYWKVRNSWGRSWGERGFIRLPMGENACGIADEATYVKATPVSAEVVV
jgi:C1A family cysteine protease